MINITFNNIIILSSLLYSYFTKKNKYPLINKTNKTEEEYVMKINKCNIKNTNEMTHAPA